MEKLPKFILIEILNYLSEKDKIKFGCCSKIILKAFNFLKNQRKNCSERKKKENLKKGNFIGFDKKYLTLNEIKYLAQSLDFSLINFVDKENSHSKTFMKKYGLLKKGKNEFLRNEYLICCPYFYYLLGQSLNDDIYDFDLCNFNFHEKGKESLLIGKLKSKIKNLPRDKKIIEIIKTGESIKKDICYMYGSQKKSLWFKFLIKYDLISYKDCVKLGEEGVNYLYYFIKREQKSSDFDQFFSCFLQKEIFIECLPRIKNLDFVKKYVKKENFLTLLHLSISVDNLYLTKYIISSIVFTKKEDLTFLEENLFKTHSRSCTNSTIRYLVNFFENFKI